MAERGERLPQLRELVRLTPVVTERMALEAKPADTIAGCYVLTHSATAAWETLNRHLTASRGAAFWIDGVSGAGKTHFLNYVLTLDRRAGALTTEQARRITLALEIARQITAAQLEAQVLETLARAVAGNQHDAIMSRQMGVAEAALKVMLTHAARSGIRAITLAIDFALADPHRAFEYVETMGRVAAVSKEPKFTILAAGRAVPPQNAIALEVIAGDRHELLTVAIGRALQLKEESRPTLARFYQSIELIAFAAEEIFPLHPVTVSALSNLAGPLGTVAGIAAMVQEILASGAGGHQLSLRRLLLPCDLLESVAVSRRVDERLGGVGRAALKMARAALADLNEQDSELGRQVISTLVLDRLFGDSAALDFVQLKSRLPEQSPSATSVEKLLERIATASKGTIWIEGTTARFDPMAADAPLVEAFNAALPLAKLFDPTLTPAQELAEAQAKLARLSHAMTSAEEAAYRAGESLKTAAEKSLHKLSLARIKAIADFSALAASGPKALLETAADDERRGVALEAISAYETVARAAASAPHLRSMSEYLEGTGLTEISNEARDTAINQLVMECSLLVAELDSQGPIRNPETFRSLEARFNKFKWTYAGLYEDAHARFRTHSLTLSRVAEDARRHLEALVRLDSIAVLGPPAAGRFRTSMADLAVRVTPCSFDGPLAPADFARCRCGFVLGTVLPESQLIDLFDRIKSALRVKLASLSRGAIARLMQEHDRVGRLEGFLKIIQAAQTEALVQVLDDDLASYLSDLLDEESVVPARAVTDAQIERKVGRRSKTGI
jgi:hypothetical protein